MKILIASDSYKGCMTSKQACQAIENGILSANPDHEVKQFPMADGGEGTADVLCDIIQGQKVSVTTIDAYGKPIESFYATNGKTAVMDVASCIGLNMYPRNRRNPMIASSSGVGRLMKEALDSHPQTLIIGLGGSCTNDGGMGILHEFGIRFYDHRHQLLKPNVYALNRIAYIDKTDFKKPNTEIIIACDVRNHLLGPQGATYIFGGQKGIFENQMEQVDGWMTHYRNQIRQCFHIDLNKPEGSGAAGGIGSVLLGLFHARMIPGIELVIQQSDMETYMKECDLVFTGEGQTDAQTKYGKVPYGIAALASRYNKPVLCLSGALGKGYCQMYQEGLTGIFSTADRAMSFQQALAAGPQKLEALSYSIIKMIDGLREKGTL